MLAKLKAWLRPRLWSSFYYETKAVLDKWAADNQARAEKFDRLLASERRNRL
jgi:hypothetical protein